MVISETIIENRGFVFQNLSICGLVIMVLTNGNIIIGFRGIKKVNFGNFDLVLRDNKNKTTLLWPLLEFYHMILTELWSGFSSPTLP